MPLSGGDSVERDGRSPQSWLPQPIAVVPLERAVADPRLPVPLDSVGLHLPAHPQGAGLWGAVRPGDGANVPLTATTGRA